MTAANPHHHHPEEEEDDGDDFTPGNADVSSRRDGKSAEPKTNNPRSKHSETEQRRRSKINERFQILKDLIPPNDQKRDKASLLLEVIEYIQFLQEKIQLYEGPYQGWSQEATKLTPWRSNHGLGEGYSDHSAVLKNGPGHENNVVQPIVNMQSSVEPEFVGDVAYRGVDHVSELSPAPPLSMSSFSTICSSERSIVPPENPCSQSGSRVWPGITSIADCSITENTMAELDGTPENSRSNVCNAYSQGLLKNLTAALQTSGVDMSQANISVQLDIGKRDKTNHTLSTSASEHPVKESSGDQHLMHYREIYTQDSNQPAKRFRKGES